MFNFYNTIFSVIFYRYIFCRNLTIFIFYNITV